MFTFQPMVTVAPHSRIPLKSRKVPGHGIRPREFSKSIRSLRKAYSILKVSPTCLSSGSFIEARDMRLLEFLPRMIDHMESSQRARRIVPTRSLSPLSNCLDGRGVTFAYEGWTWWTEHRFSTSNPTCRAFPQRNYGSGGLRKLKLVDTSYKLRGAECGLTDRHANLAVHTNRADSQDVDCVTSTLGSRNAYVCVSKGLIKMRQAILISAFSGTHN